MAPRTAFASDFDGTLYFHHGGGFEDEGPRGYRPEDVAAIRAYQEAGGAFGICTGRAIDALRMQYYDMVDPDFVIALTGAVVYGRGGKVIWRREAPLDVLADVCERYRDVARMILFTSGDDYQLLVGEPAFPLRVIASMDELEPPHHGMAIELDVGQDELASRIAGEINAEYGDVLAAFQNLASVDIVPAGCSKGAALAIVRREFGAEIVAGMGDSFNDLTMLEAADVSYTFAHVPERVRDAADVVVSGIAEALRDLRSR